MIQDLDSWAHLNRWHDRPAENVFLAAGLLALALLLPPFPGGLLILAASAMAAVWAGVPPQVLLRTLLAPCLFLAVGSLPLLVALRLEPGGRLTIAFSPSGLLTAFHTGLRALGATAALILLAVTTPAPAVIELLRRLHAPAALLDLMGLTYRFLFLLDAVAGRMIAAQDARLGYRDLRTGFRSAALAVLLLFSRTLARAQAIEQGLAARGYDGALRVLDQNRPPARRRLAVIALAHAAIALSCFALQRLAHG